MFCVKENQYLLSASLELATVSAGGQFSREVAVYLFCPVSRLREAKLPSVGNWQVAELACRQIDFYDMLYFSQLNAASV